MKLCVFQGTFNPIHNVHMAMANYVKNNFDFDTILFIPAYKPPHKEFDDDLANHRLQMVKLAIEGENSFSISNIEYQNERYSYTYLTIEELYKRYKVDGKINFIIGTDAFYDLEGWYEADKLKKIVEFIVFAREDEINQERMIRMQNKGYQFKFAKMDFINLSSSLVRAMIKKGKPTGNLIPFKALEYINQHGLYREKQEQHNQKA